jgi:general secretion pathway protein L
VNEYLIVRISNQLQAKAPWWIWTESDERVTESGELASWQDLADLCDLAHSRKTILLINGADVLLKQLELPKGSARHLSKMLPFLIEDDVAQEVESLHLAVVNRQGQQAFVAGLDRNWFSQVWALCEQVGIKLFKALPDVLALPKQDDVTLLNWQDQWLVRRDEQAAYVIDSDWLHVLQNSGWLNEQVPVVLFAPNGALVCKSYPQWQHREIESEQALLSMGALATPFSLLTGVFKTSGMSKSYWSIWRNAVYAGITFTVLYCASSLLATNQMDQKSQALRVESERIFRSVFPDLHRIPTVSYLKRQMGDELGRLSGGNPENSLLANLDFISASLSQIKGLTVNRINFDASRNEVRVDLQGQDFQQFESARKALDTKFGIKSGPLNRNDKVVLGSLTLTLEH